VLRSATVLGLLAAAVAGCGDDEKKSSSTARATTQTAAAAAAAPAGKDGLEEIVSRCHLSPLRSPTPDVVPAEFKPEHTRVIAAQKSDSGFTATLYYDRSVTDAYKSLRQSVAAAGYVLSRSENEGRDAELFLERDGKPTEVRLSTARDCANASRAVVASGSEEGGAEG
jgi:hypothetical protein